MSELGIPRNLDKASRSPILTFQCAQNYLGLGGGLLKHILVDHIPSFFICLNWTLKICIYNKFPRLLVVVVLSSFLKQNSIFSSILLMGPWELRKATYFLEII